MRLQRHGCRARLVNRAVGHALYAPSMIRVLALSAVAVLVAFGSAQTTDEVIRTKCASEWPTDFEMQSYCQRQQRQAVKELQQLRATNGGIPQEAFRTVLQGCVRDWPDDFEMQAYCIRQQIQGYADVSRGPSSPVATLTEEEEATIEQHCSAQWPGDFEMRAYCERQQVDGVAYLRMQSNAGALTACARDWPGDYEMQAYCVREGLH